VTLRIFISGLLPLILVLFFFFFFFFFFVNFQFSRLATGTLKQCEARIREGSERGGEGCLNSKEASETIRRIELKKV
jgi:hypothetical protein